MAVLRAIMTTRGEEKEAGGSGGNGTATLMKEAEAEARREIPVKPPRASGRNVGLTARHTATPQPERLHATKIMMLDVWCHILISDRAFGLMRGLTSNCKPANFMSHRLKLSF